jgi:origin recognition complex subunit 5
VTPDWENLLWTLFHFCLVCSHSTMNETGRLSRQISEKFPGREIQINLLVSLVSDKHAITPPLFLYGPSATGKTSILHTLLSHFDLSHAFVDCSVIYSRALLFEQVLNQLISVRRNEDQSDERISCSTPYNFITHLKRHCAHRKEITYLVFDHAERLRTEPLLLSLLLRLDELTGAPICVILVSNIVWEKFHMKTGVREPIPIHFPYYERDQLIAICCLECPTGENEDFFRGFVGLLIDLVAICCCDLNELRRLLRELFPKFKEPIILKGLKQEDTTKLFASIRPHLNNIWQRLYLRNITADTPNHKGLDLELAYYAKYLILASYLASYNDPKLDVQYFSKTTSGRRKRKGGRRVPKIQDTNQQLVGPRAFTLPRLLAIFYSILDDEKRSECNANDIFLQISSLVSLNFLTHTVDSNTNIDDYKLKCNVEYSFVEALAANVQFELNKYLQFS